MAPSCSWISLFLFCLNLCDAFSPNFQSKFLSGFEDDIDKIQWIHPLYKEKTEEVQLTAKMHPQNKKSLKIINRAKVLLVQQIKDGRTLDLIPFKSKTLESGANCESMTKYRTMDGSCNNLDHPQFGQAFSLLRRLVPSQYDDDEGSPRGLSDNLPSARQVSKKVHQTTEVHDNKHTHALMQWGQYIAHDLSLTLLPKEGGKALDCTACPPINKECLPIVTSSEVEVFKCLPFTRSAPRQFSGPRNQMNTITSWMDASSVYGSNDEDAKKLRGNTNGEMVVVQVHHKEYVLPEIRGFDKCKSPNETTMPCFRAGDPRNTVTPALTSFHTLWLRAHNNIANRLNKLNPHWTDEILFQETRKIISALHQQIHYEEYLPIVLGSEVMTKYNLNTRSTVEYNSAADCNADISNLFATAGFRFGHSMIANSFKMGEKSARFDENWWNPSLLYKTSRLMGKIVKGLTEQKCENSDRFFDVAVRDKVFGGLDLAAINIQRGRDHGLPSYTKVRSDLGISVPTSFDDLSTRIGMDEKTISALREVYSKIEDIDVFTGLMCEPHFHGGIVGELNGHILAEQFQKLKTCDRFYYELRGGINHFSEEKLNSIREISFATLMCQTFDIEEIQPHVFNLPTNWQSGANSHRKCTTYKNIDLEPWKEI